MERSMTSIIRLAWVVSLTMAWYVEDWTWLLILLASNYSIVFLFNRIDYKSILYIIFGLLSFFLLIFLAQWLLIWFGESGNPFQSASFASMKLLVSAAALPLFLNESLHDDALISLTLVPIPIISKNRLRLCHVSGSFLIQPVVFLTALLSVPARYRSIDRAQSMAGAIPFDSFKRIRLLFSRPTYLIWDIYVFPLIVRSIEDIPVIVEGLTLKGFGEDTNLPWSPPRFNASALPYVFGIFVNIYIST